MRHLTGTALDRLDGLRTADDILTPGTRVLTFDPAVTAVLVREDAGGPRLVLTPLADPRPEDSLVLLGERDGARWAARALASDEQAAAAATAAATRTANGARFESVRGAASSLPAAEAGLVLYGAGLLGWHRRARFCGECGGATTVSHAGHQRACGDCGATQFPRTDPAVITLVRRGDRCLLVSQPRWPEDRYAAVAGFVEPGETLEQAVAREVAEEVGLGLRAVEYFASQPWPFPHSLMIAFRATAAEGPLRLGAEIRDARWFTRSELRDAVAAEEVTLPTTFSISRSLIDDWLAPPRP